jgi:hypothetical protein
LRLRRTRAALASTLALLVGAAAAACGAVLGLDAPTLAPSSDGAALPPVLDAGGSGDSAPQDDAAPVNPADGGVDAPPDAPPDTSDDQAAPTGVRCGSGASEIFCTAPATCCLVYDDAGATSYSCAASAGACAGYPIACATNNDCSGSDVCCFYHTGIKCESDTNPTCTSLVCDPSGPADQCNAGQTCDAGFIDAGLAYHVCTG